MSFELFTVLSVVLWVAAAPRLRDLSPGATPSRRSVAVAITALAVTTTAFSETPSRVLNESTGVDYLHELVGRIALMVAAVAAQCIFLILPPDPATGATAHNVPESDRRSAAGTVPTTVVRTRVAVLLLAVALLAVTFTITAVTSPPPPGANYLANQGEQLSLAGYVTVFTALLGWAFFDLIRAWSRLRPHVAGSLRIGLGLLAAGAAAGLGYVALRFLGMIAGALSWASLAPIALWGCIVTGSATALLVTAGISWHSIDGSRAGVRVLWTNRRRLLALGPLWRDLTRSVPGIALQPPTRADALLDRLRVLNLSWLVYRRVIEIQDGSLALVRHPGAPDPRTARPAGAWREPASVALSAARVLTEVAPPRPDGSTTMTELADGPGEADQIDRLVSIAEDHARRRSPFAHRPLQANDERGTDR